jgi:hypothetical protein
MQGVFQWWWVMVAIGMDCVLGALALTGGRLPLTTHHAQASALCLSRRVLPSSPALAMSGADGSGSREPEKDAKAKRLGQGTGNRLLDVLEFVVSTTFSSRLYVGSPDLHIPLPIPQPQDYPDFIPQMVRLPTAVYDLVDAGVAKGWAKKASAESMFEIKYGVLRGEVTVIPDDKCEPCELEKRKQASQRRT